MRIVVSILLVFSLLLNSGCGIIEKETTNRGGYLDAVLDEHWLRADSKGMRALRAFAIQVSLARIASVSAKNDSDRQLLAIRLGALTKRFVPIYLCAFNTNPLGTPGAERDPCFYYDSAMLDYSTGLFDLAMIALPLEDAKKLVTMVTGAAINPLNVIELLTNLLQIGKDAIKYGRIVGALYRDTVELEVQVWLGTPAVDQRAPPYRVTAEDVAPLAEVYARGNDNMPAWLGEMAALRARGLEPIPQPKFFAELAGLLNYMCDLITKDPDANSPKTCKANLPETLPPPAKVLGAGPAMRIGDARIPSAALLRNPAAATSGRLVTKKDDNLGQATILDVYKGYLQAYNKANDTTPRIEGVLLALCVPKSDFASVNKVKHLIKIYEAGIYQGAAPDRENGLLDPSEMEQLSGMGPCKTDVYRNAYERTAFVKGTAVGIAGPLSRVKGIGTVAETAPLKDIRDKIKQARDELKMKDAVIADEITIDLFNKLLEPAKP